MNFFKIVYLAISRLLYFLIPLILVLSCIITLYFENVLSLILSVGLPLIVVLNAVVFIYLAFRKRKQAILLLLALVIYGLSHVFFFKFSLGKKVDTPPDSLSVLTFNVRGGGGAGHTTDRFNRLERIDKMKNFVENQDADILVFQEFWRTKFESFKNYPYAFIGQRKGVSKSLQLILSKYPIVNKGYVDFPNTANNAMYADVQIEHEIIRIYNVHLQSFSVEVNSEFFTETGLKTVYPKIDKGQKMKSAQTELLLEGVKEFKGRSIICGDFNATPFSKTYKTISKDRLDSFLEAGSGFGETYNLLGYPMRLDYVLPDTNFEVIAHENFNLQLSDHEPILVYLKLKN
ncbi:endonuclease/exonuclease/phosphatase family protein [Tamlana agarivorans]|uniref:Endonuclease/exonuclease/phosphatase family protein n=1 Tax=Pseudotamlana agarivorans TaxID=481183 RepID=A0ACC5UB30_9FLAO|nr:endonuclease/exonuclease/phosphatase family protein [Tamlana agarivorans]MBU2951534.1 endonuclease/exonuclease/phosphatase family protein [Tamlana agarivorans]